MSYIKPIGFYLRHQFAAIKYWRQEPFPGSKYYVSATYLVVQTKCFKKQSIHSTLDFIASPLRWATQFEFRSQAVHIKILLEFDGAGNSRMDSGVSSYNQSLMKTNNQWEDDDKIANIILLLYLCYAVALILLTLVYFLLKPCHGSGAHAVNEESNVVSTRILY